MHGHLVPSLKLNRGDASWTVGRVLSTERYSQLSIQGSGGVSGHGPHVSGSMQIDSRTDWMHELWLETSEGREASFRIPRPDIPLRKDQQIGVLTLKHPSRSTADPVLLVNENAGSWMWLMSPRALVYQFGDCSTNSPLVLLLDATLASGIAFPLALLNARFHIADVRLVPACILCVVTYCALQCLFRAVRFTRRRRRVVRWMADVDRWRQTANLSSQPTSATI